MSTWKFGQVYEKNGEWFGLNGPPGEIDEGRYLRKRNETAAIAKELAEMLEQIFDQLWARGGFSHGPTAQQTGVLLGCFRVQEKMDSVIASVEGECDWDQKFAIVAYRLDALIAEVSKLK